MRQDPNRVAGLLGQSHGWAQTHIADCDPAKRVRRYLLMAPDVAARVPILKAQRGGADMKAVRAMPRWGPLQMRIREPARPIAVKPAHLLGRFVPLGSKAGKIPEGVASVRYRIEINGRTLS